MGRSAAGLCGEDTHVCWGHGQSRGHLRTPLGQMPRGPARATGLLSMPCLVLALSSCPRAERPPFLATPKRLFPHFGDHTLLSPLGDPGPWLQVGGGLRSPFPCWDSLGKPLHMTRSVLPLSALPVLLRGVQALACPWPWCLLHPLALPS